jgi:hypothetical protein
VSDSTIRASEIGSYLYCHRAWWYQRRGVRSANVRELARGAQAHEAHGRSVRRLGWQRGLALGLVALALLLLLWQALS